jgi:hypothetical protein
MLLIVTERGDLTADWLILELEDREAPFVRFNTEDYPTRRSIAWAPTIAELSMADATHPLSEFDAVWYRRPVPPVLPELPPEQRDWAAREATEALFGVWRTLDAFWVNHPDANRLAESKPDQLRTAAQLGFEIPTTLITNRRDRLREFLAEHPNGVVCKPLWDGRVPASDGKEQLFFTTALDTASIDIDRLTAEPYLFQEHVTNPHPAISG